MTLHLVSDPGAWDSFVATSLKPHAFQSWGWGDIKAGTGWRPVRLALERDGALRAGLSMLERDFPAFGLRFFYAPRGPVLREGWSADDLSSLFSHVRSLAKERKAVFLKIDPDVPADNNWLAGPFSEAGFRAAPASGGFAGVQPRCVFRLDISGTEDALLTGMDQKTRYNIRVAEKKGVKIRPITSAGDIATFYDILVETARRDGFLIRPLRYFQDIHKELSPRGQSHYFLAEAEGRAIAGALLITLGPVAWYTYGASSNDMRHLMPNHLMQWTLIRRAKSLGCRLYDFRAVPCNPDPADPLYGLYRFKKGFGGEFVRFAGELDMVFRPLSYAAWVRGWPAFKSARKWWLRDRRARHSSHHD